MSGKNHKLNGNSVLSTSVSSTAATTTVNLVNNNSKNNNNSNNCDIVPAHHQQVTSATSNKLQASQQQQQHQRRSLLPPSSSQSIHSHSHTHIHTHPHLHRHLQSTQLTQQHSVTTVAETKAPTNVSAHPNQLQTVATIHHHHSHQPQQHNPYSQQQTQSNNNNAQIAATTAHTAIKTSVQQSQSVAPNIASSAGNTQSRRRLHHLQAQLLKSNNLKAPANSIPPRYQPPPQPAPQTHSQVLATPQTNSAGIGSAGSCGGGGGILKHFNTLSKTTSSKPPHHHTTYFSDTSHLNLKYPPDIPQLSTVYIPDPIKTTIGSNSSRYLQQQDMLKFVRKSDQDHPSPNASVTSSATGIPTATGRLSAEQSRQLQSLINELRSLKEQNQRLMDDNQELRDLCCFLDDDRQKGRKLAREWQRFGRYTASVMRQEVAAYQNKLRQLDDKQQELITDNLELKELCLYLDEERAHVAANAMCTNCGASARNTLRDDGDGSSSSTNADETLTALRNYERQLPEVHLRTAALNDQTLQYVRSLERRIQQLEEERITATTPTANLISQQQQQDNLSDPISGRPEAVVRALQVLEVREQLERDRLSNLDQMDDGEKALVREMCNVVWRKLEGGTPNGSNPLEPL